MASINGINEWRLVSLAPWGRAMDAAAVVVALTIIALAVIALRHEGKALRRWSLIALRVGAVTAALVLFFQPAVQLENVTKVPNHVAVLVDASESMTLSEHPGESRAARAAKLITSSHGTFERWRAEHQLDFYTFGDRLSAGNEEALKTPRKSGEESTRLREALGELRTHYEGRDLGGVVVISDGIDNGRFASIGATIGEASGASRGASDEPVARRMPASIKEASDFVKGLDVPIHTVWAATPGINDIAVKRVLADDFAFVRNALKVDAVISVRGAEAANWVGKILPVSLRRDGAVVDTTQIRIEPDKLEYTVSFRFTPERVGKYLYEIVTPVQLGEAIAENNSRTFLLKVIRDKIRVLLVCGRPSWDERFLRSLLKHDPNVDLISFFILRTPSDIENVSSDELSLIPFPTEELFQEQLRSFDVIFLQNFNFSPYGIGAYLGEIRRYVEEGGGLAMLGGDLSFTQGGYFGTPIADLLPVDLIEPGAPLADLAPFKLALTPEGRSHPLTALKLEVGDNEKLWSALPELDGTNLVARARPGATVLGTHPTLKGLDGKPLPVLSVMDASKGRVLALTSDSSWRWSFDSAVGHLYERFWENAIRWLIHDPSLSLVRVETDQSEYARGQKIHVTARVLSPDYQPLPGASVVLSIARVTTESSGADARPTPVASKSGKTDDSGELTTELDELPPGGYRVSARATVSGRAMVEDEVFLIRGAGKELEEAEGRDDILKLVAQASGGNFQTTREPLDSLTFLPPRVVRVNQHRDLELWSGWWVLAIAALCLSANWALRRKWGYA